MSEITHYEHTLLSTLISGPKRVHMGSSPVSAITAAFRMIEKGLAIMDTHGLISITAMGRQVLASAGEAGGEDPKGLRAEHEHAAPSGETPIPSLPSHKEGGAQTPTPPQADGEQG